MADHVLDGPFPRQLTSTELRTIANRAKVKIERAILESAGLVFSVQDRLNIIYTVRFGSDEEVLRDDAKKCGELGSHGSCHLARGHEGPHCCVLKWDSQPIPAKEK